MTKDKKEKKKKKKGKKSWRSICLCSLGKMIKEGIPAK